MAGAKLECAEITRVFHRYLKPDSAFNPISERPLPLSPCSSGVAVPLLWSGSRRTGLGGRHAAPCREDAASTAVLASRQRRGWSHLPAPRSFESRPRRSLLEALPLRIGADSHPRFAAMTPSLDSFLARDEPNELSDCPTPSQSGRRVLVRGSRVSRRGEAVSRQLPELNPGG